MPELVMFRKILIVLLVLVLAACTTAPTPVSTPSAEQMDADEQAVFAALLQKLYAAPSYVIMDTTATSPGGVGDTASSLERVGQDLAGLDQATSDSFQARNAAVTPIRGDMQLGSPYVVLSQAAMSQMFSQNRDGWQVFYEQYPDAPGIITLSCVGFNATFDQALVYIGIMSHWLAGAGTFALLKKVNGTWIVDQQVITWIS